MREHEAAGSSTGTNIAGVEQTSFNKTSSGNGERHDLRRILVVGDLVAVIVGWLVPSLWSAGSSLRLLGNQPPAENIVVGAAFALSIALTMCVIAGQRLYVSRICSMRTAEVARIGRTAVAVALLSLMTSKLIGEEHMVRVPLVTAGLVYVLLNLWRTAYSTWLKSARRRGRFIRSVILVGANDEAFNLYSLFEQHPELGYRICGIVCSAAELDRHHYAVPWLGEPRDLKTIIAATGIRGAVVAGGSLGRSQLNSVTRQLLEQQVHVHLSTGIFGIDHRRMRSQSMAYEPMVYVERAHLEGWQQASKRLIDLTLASTLLVLTAPLVIIAALVIKARDGGPILFRQRRIGRHGKPFQILKLRSMVLNAEDQLVNLRRDNAREEPLFKLTFDPRVTGIGRILRATSIDEIPQLINVLRGDMSLVGPRPALPSEVEQFDDALMVRQNVLPGITGLWQVEARDNPDFALYHRLDVYYVENWSVALDVSILLGTAKVVLMRALQAFQRMIIKLAAGRKHRRATVLLD